MTLAPVPVPHFSPTHPGLDWLDLRTDPGGPLIPTGVLVAVSRGGVCLTLAEDHRDSVLALDPDAWADLCDAIKLGRLDRLMGGRIMCSDPNRPLNPEASISESAPPVSALGLSA